MTTNTAPSSAVASKVLLSGNEALARGAIEAGVLVVAGYPGTPSNLEALGAGMQLARGRAA